MNTFGSILFLFIPILAMNNYRTPNGQDIPVMVTGLQSNKGQIILNVFKDKDSYKDQKPCKQIIFDKSAVKNGSLIVNINLYPGTYGITLVDDTNDNDALDKNTSGKPTEGFGFSNFYLKKMKRPAFNDFKIVVNSGNDIFDGNDPVEIQVEYMRPF
jgi:uncharacterized protein (DUF2141 family)